MRPDSGVDPQALRAARVGAGLTQHELAHRIGVGGGERISRWELGTSSPRPQLLHRLADAVGVDVGALLTPADDPDLRRLRVMNGLSARELATRAHMSLPTLVRWESGRIAQIPRRAALEPLAVALGVSIDAAERAVSRARGRT